ncbi:tetratricopeptide repeat protein [Venatoribacter cucullus]|uniref:Tetratricopeptide repeat protein n=1 Tax=Venatoribacter cucullus TaxID=2661630 RepID=A0A9E8FJI6_9GAMM|nr:tetratricopeptide repeat protein [Venatoribacter cucullus]QQD23592.1 tetratricopeptide repeat protein [Venatoribacter cucullus]UZK03022.1 tetratricopeptide repeat protein [Venatoribacter cucullus]
MLSVCCGFSLRRPAFFIPAGWLLLLLSGCTTLTTPPAAAPAAPAAAPITNATVAAPATGAATTAARPIPAATLYSLLVAEMAGQRQRFDIALYHYMDQARTTGDPAIAERAARIAQFVGSPPHASEAVDIWLQSEPDNPAPHQAAAQLLMEQGQHQQALQHLEELQRLTGISQYDYLAANAGHLPAEQQQELLQHLQQLLQQQPDNASLWYACAIMQQHLARYDEALHSTEKALQKDPQHLSAGIQKARILVLLKRPDDALQWLQKLRRQHPQNKGIQVLQARILLEQRRMEDALNAFSELHKNFPEDAAILLSLALLYEEAGQYEQASACFYQLLASQAHVNEAHFYLGRIADKEGRPDQAINHFSQVDSGREFLPAQLRAAQLMEQEHGLAAARDFLQEQQQQHPQHQTDLLRIEIELLSSAGEYQTALNLLSDELQQQPEHIDLRYTRAMLAERTDNLPLMEADLRHIIERQPQHAEALNALGYALADRTERWAEALPFIERALEISPDNPAVIDSLGWVYFRMGDIDKALPLLEQAFSLMPDHEIAAHLGEVLWLTGDRERALEVWQQGYEQTPDSPIIDRTLERLQVNPGASGSSGF